MKRPTEPTVLLLLLLPLLRPCHGAASGGGNGSRRSVRLIGGGGGPAAAADARFVPDGKAAERWRAGAPPAAAARQRSASSNIVTGGGDDSDDVISGRISHRRFHQDAEFDGVASLTAAYRRRKRDDDIDNSIAPPLLLLLDQSPAAAKAIARSPEDSRQFVSPLPMLAASAVVVDEWEGRPNSGGVGEEAIALPHTSQQPPPLQQHQQNAAALLAAMSRVRLIDHQTGERTHQRLNSAAAATTASAFADGAPLAVSDQATDLRPELCRTLPVRQAVSHGGCFRRYVSNRMCAGQCNSFFVPSEGVRQQHPLFHRAPTQQQQQQRQRIVTAAGDDSEPDAVDAETPQPPSFDGFSSCAWCKPVKTSTRSVVLFCPHGASLRRLVKRYVAVEQCKCSMHRGPTEPPTAPANLAAAASLSSDYDGQEDQLTSVVEAPHTAVLESS